MHWKPKLVGSKAAICKNKLANNVLKVKAAVSFKQEIALINS